MTDVTVRRVRAEDTSAVIECPNSSIDTATPTVGTGDRTVEELAPWAFDGRPFVGVERDGRVLRWALAAVPIAVAAA